MKKKENHYFFCEFTVGCLDTYIISPKQLFDNGFVWLTM